MSLLEDSALEEADFEMPTGEPVLVDPDDVGFEGETAQRVVEQAPPRAAPKSPFSRRRAPPPQPCPVRRRCPIPICRAISPSSCSPRPQMLRPRARLPSSAPCPWPVAARRSESMIRELLRPMLKEWLDENLPSVVERLVEKEIARVSRGGL